MIYKFTILHDNKFILNKFSINKILDYIEIKNIEINFNNNLIKIPIFNKYNGINYIPIIFPLKLHIINDYIFNPYIILNSYNLDINNELDFFYKLKKIIETNFNYKLLDFNNLLNNNSLNLINIINKNYSDNINLKNLINQNNINIFINDMWLNINIIKLLIIYIILKNINISKKNKLSKNIINYISYFKKFKYDLFSYNLENKFTLNEYYNLNLNNKLKIHEIKNNFFYYINIKNPKLDIVLNKNEIIEKNHTYNFLNNKIIKIYINNKLNCNNYILLNNNKKLFFNNYEWYYFHPNININKNLIIFNTYINKNFTIELIKTIFNLDQIDAINIYNYYNVDYKINNLMIFNTIYPKLQLTLNEINILKLNLYSNNFFKNITIKYSLNNEYYKILEILFLNYTYPLTYNRHDLDINFDHILYISLYNYKYILLNYNQQSENIYDNYTKKYNILHPDINNIIPLKLRNLYINLLKLMIQLLNNNFDFITFNQKFYNDYLYRNIIKIIFLDNNINIKNNLSINLFKKLINIKIYNKFKKIIETNLLLFDISNKLKWDNLPNKLSYLNIFYKNTELIYYQLKINKNIISDNLDKRIIKIIENPFEMYKYLRKESDFIKWTKFIIDKINLLYNDPISLSSNDFNNLGKIIYLLLNITEQNLKNITYLKFINFCNIHNHLILNSNRINLKIKEYFYYSKINLNLGYLAKHLTWNKEFILSDNNNNNLKISDLENKLKIITNKYYKYKIKYYEKKDNNNNNNNSSSSTLFSLI
jgi:hypothetical protein